MANDPLGDQRDWIVGRAARLKKMMDAIALSNAQTAPVVLDTPEGVKTTAQAMERIMVASIPKKQ